MNGHVDQELLTSFERTFQASPTHRIHAPGRINLIGEHIDYTGGLVMPMTIQLGTTALMQPNGRSEIRVYSERFKEMAIIRPHQVGTGAQGHWSDYARGLLLTTTHRSVGHGFDLYVTSNLEMGGLSSSAAFLAVIALANQWVSGPGHHSLSLDDTERLAIALQCQQVENEWIGIPCGIMDPAAILLGGVRQLDCQTLRSTALPNLDEGVSLLLMDTKVPRTLAASAYEERVNELHAICDIGQQAGVGRIRHLATLSEPDAERLGQSVQSDILKRRLRHVLSEQARVISAARALANQDYPRLGALMNQSHYSLRDDYHVSCKELDWITEASREAVGGLGARLTGAGFGGAAIALVKTADISDHMSAVRDAFVEKAGYEPILQPLRTGSRADIHPIDSN